MTELKGKELGTTYWGSTGEGGAAGFPIEELRGPGRMLLHGEQEFEFHAWPKVGDVLTGTARVADVYAVTTRFTLIVRSAKPKG